VPDLIPMETTLLLALWTEQSVSTMSVITSRFLGLTPSSAMENIWQLRELWYSDRP
jgi:hypothetical protein